VEQEIDWSFWQALVGSRRQWNQSRGLRLFAWKRTKRVSPLQCLQGARRAGRASRDPAGRVCRRR
jgi:hypothetical protein